MAGGAVRRILNIAWKETLHLWKDRVLVPFFLIGAVAELILIGWATGQPIRNIPMAAVDQDKSAASAALIDALDASEELSLVRDDGDEAQIDEWMDEDAITVGVIIPAGYAEALDAREQPEVTVILNGMDAISAFTAEIAAQEIILEEGMRGAFDMEPEDYESQLPTITVKYNEDLDRSFYTLPAEMGFMFYIMTLFLAALAITRERERGTYEQLLVMPYRSWEVIIGKTLTPMVIGYVLFLTMLAVTTLVFGVPFRGALPLYLVLAVIYLLAEIGKGILLSVLGRTQLQAVTLVTLVAMVDMIFSGYAVAVETMPPFLQTLANFFSIRHWLIITRGIMLKGLGLDVLWPHVAAMMVIGAVIIALTASQYRRSLA